ncbi:hypothetical protein QVD17_38956 [Tagetes erecta]|uniref:Uncharacterized protein n=1 Tax=Tagetes erecta TaxID=13708 RepID=A0AAD8NFU0_TARER|nr:hypothetical protein QVD17_38956 [Tagetes erecta]
MKNLLKTQIEHVRLQTLTNALPFFSRPIRVHLFLCLLTLIPKFVLDLLRSFHNSHQFAPLSSSPIGSSLFHPLPFRKSFSILSLFHHLALVKHGTETSV